MNCFSKSKAYKVTRVETASALHSNTSGNTAPTPTGTQRRVSFIPPLAHPVASGTGKQIILTNPLVQVIQKGNVQQYDLSKDGLYKFSLKLEEAQY